VCCFDGAFLAIECKAGANKPTVLQDREIGAIRSAGGTAFVINETNVGDLELYIEQRRRDFAIQNG
jgi:hypothetical protein